MAQEVKIIPEAPRPERVERVPGKMREAPTRREKPVEAASQSPAEAFVIHGPEPVAALPLPTLPKTPELQAVESLLAEDLDEMYAGLPREQQRAFKLKGEEVAGKITRVISGARAHARDILKWIREWLRMIPGVNKYFLEQESKIKTDKIVALGERKQ